MSSGVVGATDRDDNVPDRVPHVICHVADSGFDGHYYRDVGRAIVAEGSDLILITLGDAPAPAWAQNLGGVRYYALRCRLPRQAPIALVRLTRLFRRHRVDVVHAHLFFGGLLGLAGAMIARTPLRILMRHHHDQHQMLRKPLHVALDRLSARIAQHVIVPSEALRTHMLDVERVATDIHVIPIGVEVSDYTDNSEAARALRNEIAPGASLVLGFVGHQVATKGVRELIEAFETLAGEIPDAWLVLVGADPGGWARALTTRSPHAERISQLGFRMDIPQLMAAFDVLVLPSYSENFPQVVVEAMASAIPVIATDVGGIPSQVDPGNTGILVRPRDPDALRSALASLADPVERARLGRNARRKVALHWSAKEMADAHLSTYRSWFADTGRAEPESRAIRACRRASAPSAGD